MTALVAVDGRTIRSRFDTDGFERPTRSAISPSDSVNSSMRTA